MGAVVREPSYTQSGAFSCDLWNGGRFGGGPDVKELANSIGIDWKGTQPPLKTDRADTLIFTLRGHPGGAVAI